MLNALVLAAGIGFVAGLRSLTAPAAVSWAAHVGWLPLRGSALGFMASPAALILLSLAALAELVADKLPRTPNRTALGPLVGRIAIGGLSGASLAISAGQSLLAGAVAGGIGAVMGTFAGYEARRRLVARLKVRDIFVAIPEDMVAIALAWLAVLAASRV